MARIWTEGEKSRLCELFSDGSLTVETIAEEFGRTPQAIRAEACLLKLSRPLLNRIVFCPQCGEKFDVDPHKSMKRARFCGHGCASASGRGLTDEAVFSHETPEVAYWAGFLMADGNVYYDKGSPVISVGLSPKDKDHLEKLRGFIGCTNPINTRKPTAVSLSFHSQRVADDLSRWGVVPRKTYVGQLPDDIPDGLLSHYLRGLIDGDGSIFITKKTAGCTLWRLSLTNNAAVVNRVHSIFEDLGFHCYKYLVRVGKTGHETYTLAVQRKAQVPRLLQWLGYAEDGPSLDRKAATARTILSFAD